MSHGASSNLLVSVMMAALIVRVFSPFAGFGCWASKSGGVRIFGVLRGGANIFLRLVPVDDLEAMAFVDVAKTVHHEFDTLYCGEKIRATNITLGTPVEYTFRWPMRHDDGCIFKDGFGAVEAAASDVSEGLLKRSSLCSYPKAQSPHAGVQDDVYIVKAAPFERVNVWVPSGKYVTPASCARGPVKRSPR